MQEVWFVIVCILKIINGVKCLLRSEMLRIYHHNKDAKSFRQYEFENFCLLYKAYKALKGKNGTLAMICSAIVCPVVNTGIFIGCMLTFFTDVLAAWAGGGEIIAYVLSGLILANFVPELLINIIFSPAGAQIARIVKK